MSLSALIMEEMIIIPKKELPEDVAFYKGELTSNAWLNKAGQLGAAKKRILNDPNLSDEDIVRKVKPLSHKLRQVTKRLRQIPPVGSVQPGEDDDLATTNVEKWLRRLANNVAGDKPSTTLKAPKTPLQEAQEDVPLLDFEDVEEPQTIDEGEDYLPETPSDSDSSVIMRPKKKKKTLGTAMLEGALGETLGTPKRKKSKKRTPSHDMTPESRREW